MCGKVGGDSGVVDGVVSNGVIYAGELKFGGFNGGKGKNEGMLHHQGEVPHY